MEKNQDIKIQFYDVLISLSASAILFYLFNPYCVYEFYVFLLSSPLLLAFYFYYGKDFFGGLSLLIIEPFIFYIALLSFFPDS